MTQTTVHCCNQPTVSPGLAILRAQDVQQLPSPVIPDVSQDRLILQSDDEDSLALLVLPLVQPCCVDSHKAGCLAGEWQQCESAIQSELANIGKYNVWDVVPKPSGRTHPGRQMGLHSQG